MLGAGNVSTHISRHLHSKGHRISCIYSRTLESATLLADEFGSFATTDLQMVPMQADCYIVCVPDKAVVSVLSQFKGWSGIWLHTAGALPMDLFKGYVTRYGVLYPLQTLSKKQEVSLASTPFLVEGSSTEVEESILELAGDITTKVWEIDSQKRLTVHLAAVFANNFTNHMVHIGQRILQENRLDIKLLDPIIEETVRKIGRLGAGAAQTGPALRKDQETIQKHLDLLKDHPDWEKIYTFISRDIDNTRE